MAYCPRGVGTRDISADVREDEDALHAWCFLEGSENEQWQEVFSMNSKLKLKKLFHESLLSVQHNSCASPRKAIEVKDNGVNIRPTMDTGAAAHVMPAEMFPRVKLDCTSATKKFVAANGERIKDLGEKATPFKSVGGVHRCINFRSASVVKPLISMRMVVQAGDVMVLDEKNPHMRNNRDGTVIKLNVNNGLCTMDMWVCLDETGLCFSWPRTVSGLSVTNKLVRPRRSAAVRVKKVKQGKS